jgi:hypothetical protein
VEVTVLIELLTQALHQCIGWHVNSIDSSALVMHNAFSDDR